MGRDEQPPLKLWLRLALMTKLEGERALIFRQAFNELFVQHKEQCYKLDIKMANKDMKVQARKGYYAVESDN